MSTPSTTIYLCTGVPLNNSYDHTMYFSSADAQYNYFTRRVDRQLNDYTYVRKSWTLKVDATMEEARLWSYLFFRNGTSGKWYYYFVNQIEYINDNVVELKIEMDVMQTYMFDWELRPCYVEREHSVSDVWGENTIDEGLDVGDLVVREREIIDLTSDLSIMTAATIDINKLYESNTESHIIGTVTDSLFGGFEITATPQLNNEGEEQWSNFAMMIRDIDSKGKSEAIFNMWMFPTKLIGTWKKDDGDHIAQYVSGALPISHTAKPRPKYYIGSHEVKNRKLLQYPFCFMYATNNSGGSAIYKYEHFSTESRTFRIQGNIAPDAIVTLTPVLYKGMTHNYDESLSMGNYPTCAWNSDPYKLWLAQNQNSQNLGLALAGGQIAVGAAAAFAGQGIAAASMISGGAQSIATQLAARKDMDVQPPQSKGTHSGSYNISRGLQNFDIYHKTVDDYHAKIIDDFFSMYGYATRQVKVPNISSRPNWNYVKTVGSNIGGDFCMEDKTAINNIFDRGITFWMSDEVGNYDLDNHVI